MKELPLSQGQVALVDDEDYEFLSQFKWYAHRTKSRWKAPFYARRTPKDKKTILMHRVIMGEIPPGLVIDHIDRNGLNNQRSNLRFVTRLENNLNRSNRFSTSPWVGVTAQPRNRRNPFIAQLYITPGRIRYLGSFPTREAAAAAHTRAKAALASEEGI